MNDYILSIMVVSTTHSYFKILTVVTYLVFINISIYSCQEDSPLYDCQNCTDENIIESFDNYYLRYLDDFRNRRVLYYDSTKKIESIYYLCQPDSYDTLEATKIIKAEGSLHLPCSPDSVTNVLITNYEIVQNCPEDQPIIEGEFGIVNKWNFHHLIFNDSIIYLPCESPDSYINISTYTGSENFNLQMEGTVAENSFWAPTNMIEDTLHLSSNFTRTLSVGTKSETNFESIYYEAIRENAILQFEIVNNHINLKNIENMIELNFYAK